MKATVRASTLEPLEPLEPRRHLAINDLDTAFGNQGSAIFDPGPQSENVTAAVQPDGRLLIAGHQGSNAYLARLNTDGSPDASFAINGIAKLDLGANESIKSIAVLPDNKILVAGNTVRGSRQRGFLARYRADGALDTSTRFGDGDGIQILPASETIAAMTVTESKIVTVGGQTVRQQNMGTGHLDSAFGASGQIDLVALSVLDELTASDVAVSPAGKIAVSGYGFSPDPTELIIHHREEVPNSHGNVIVVLNPSGALDSNFDTNGVVFYDSEGSTKITYAPSGGTLLVADSIGGFLGGPSGLYHFLPDGTSVFTAAGSQGGEAIGVLSNGKIMIANSNAASRLNSDGSLDFTFSDDGTVATDQRIAPAGFDTYGHYYQDRGSAELIPWIPGPGVIYGNDIEDGGAAIAPDGSAYAIQSLGRDAFVRPIVHGPILIEKFLPQPTSLGVSATLDNSGTLTITTPAGDDQVSIDLDGDEHVITVTIDQQQYTFAEAEVGRISATLGAGNDSYYGKVSLPQTVLGQDGNDTLFSSNSNDWLIGGAGNDSLDGGAGNDSLFGGGEKDTLYGSEGDDTLYGGNGNDDLFGGEFYTLAGSDGADVLHGNAGNDFFQTTDSAADSIFGGAGTDRAIFDANVDVLTSIETRP